MRYATVTGAMRSGRGRDMFGAQAQHVPSTGATCTEQTRNVLRAKAVKKRLFHATGLAVMKDLRTFAN